MYAMSRLLRIFHQTNLHIDISTDLQFACLFIPRHPLFPLLALLFEKCEQSTQGSEGTTSASFDVDIENFVRKQEKEGKPFFCEDPETDNLVSKNILDKISIYL